MKLSNSTSGSSDGTAWAGNAGWFHLVYSWKCETNAPVRELAAFAKPNAVIFVSIQK